MNTPLSVDIKMTRLKTSQPRKDLRDKNLEKRFLYKGKNEKLLSLLNESRIDQSARKPYRSLGKSDVFGGVTNKYIEVCLLYETHVKILQSQNQR